MKRYNFKDLQQMFNIDMDGKTRTAGNLLLKLKPILQADCPSLDTIKKFLWVEKNKAVAPEVYQQFINDEITLGKAKNLIQQKLYGK